MEEYAIETRLHLADLAVTGERMADVLPVETRAAFTAHLRALTGFCEHLINRIESLTARVVEQGRATERNIEGSDE